MNPRDPRLDIEGLYRTHRAEVYRVALRKLGDHHEAEDVTQTAFLDAYRAMLRGSHPELPRAWLLAIAENVRRRRFRPAVSRLREEPLRDDYAALDSAAREQAETIRAALGKLAKSQRRAFLLRELGGLSYGDIAARLGTSVPAVQMLLFRARQKLRAEIGSTGGLGSFVGPQALAGVASRLHVASGAPQVAAAVAATAVVAGLELTPTAPAPPTRTAPALSEPSPAPAPPITVRDRTALPRAVRPKRAPVRRSARPASRPERGPVHAVNTRPKAPSDVRVHVQHGGEPVQPRDEPVQPGAEPVARVAPPATPETSDGPSAPVLSPVVTSVTEVPIVSAAVPDPPPSPGAPLEPPPVPPDVVIVLPLPEPTDVAGELVSDEVGSSLAPG